jgi:hypothetical protein
MESVCIALPKRLKSDNPSPRLSRQATAAIIICLLFAQIVLAQQKACSERAIPVAAHSLKGDPLPDLTQVSFETSYRGKSLRLGPAAPEQEPNRIVLILDTSGSMLGSTNSRWNFPINTHESIDPPQMPPATQDEWSFPLRIARDFVLQAPPTIEIGIVFFSANIWHTLSPSTDHKKLVDDMATFRKRKDLPGGATALWDSIRDSVGIFGPPRVGDALYLITDGIDNASKSRPQEIAQTLGAVGIRLFAFELRYETRAMMMHELPERETLQPIVQDTGGLVFVYAGDDTALVGRSGKPSAKGRGLDALYRGMFRFNLLEIGQLEPASTPQSLELSLEGMGKSKKTDLSLVYPHNLVPCQFQRTF